jgi:hypothetical protein
MKCHAIRLAWVVPPPVAPSLVFAKEASWILGFKALNNTEWRKVNDKRRGNQTMGKPQSMGTRKRRVDKAHTAAEQADTTKHRRNGKRSRRGTFMNDDERELDLQVGDLQREVAAMRRQLARVTDESIYLRHALQHIYAKALLALEPMATEVKVHYPETGEQ